MSYVKRDKPTKHSYFKPLLEMGAEATPGRVTHVTVEHDDWCHIFKGGYCNCHPVLRYGAPETPRKI